MIFRFNTPQQVIITVYVLGGRTTKIYSQEFLKPRVTSTAVIWEILHRFYITETQKKKNSREDLITCKAYS